MKTPDFEIFSIGRIAGLCASTKNAALCRAAIQNSALPFFRSGRTVTDTISRGRIARRRARGKFARQG